MGSASRTNCITSSMDQEEGFLPGSWAPSRSDARDSGPVVELAANKAPHTCRYHTGQQVAYINIRVGTDCDGTFYSSVRLCGVEHCGVGGEPADGHVSASRVVEAVDLRVVLGRTA